MKPFSLFLLVLSSIACSLSIHAQSDRFVCDESCDSGSSGVAKFNVVSPVGFSTVEPIEMSSRLQTLDGKTIAIVGEDFMYNVWVRSAICSRGVWWRMKRLAIEWDGRHGTNNKAIISMTTPSHLPLH